MLKTKHAFLFGPSLIITFAFQSTSLATPNLEVPTNDLDGCAGHLGENWKSCVQKLCGVGANTELCQIQKKSALIGFKKSQAVARPSPYKPIPEILNTRIHGGISDSYESIVKQMSSPQGCSPGPFPQTLELCRENVKTFRFKLDHKTSEYKDATLKAFDEALRNTPNLNPYTRSTLKYDLLKTDSQVFNNLINFNAETLRTTMPGTTASDVPLEKLLEIQRPEIERAIKEISNKLNVHNKNLQPTAPQ